MKYKGMLSEQARKPRNFCEDQYEKNGIIKRHILGHVQKKVFSPTQCAWILEIGDLIFYNLNFDYVQLAPLSFARANIEFSSRKIHICMLIFLLIFKKTPKISLFKRAHQLKRQNKNVKILKISIKVIRLKFIKKSLNQILG